MHPNDALHAFYLDLIELQRLEEKDNKGNAVAIQGVRRQRKKCAAALEALATSTQAAYPNEDTSHFAELVREAKELAESDPEQRPHTNESFGELQTPIIDLLSRMNI